MRKFPYKKGDTVTIYKDWQNNTDPIGAARLVRKYKTGCTFILTEMLPESSQIVYNYEEWIVEGENIPTIVKIRYLHNIGLTPSAIDEDPEEYKNTLYKDTFIIINGIEVF
jgi:hypothetical protein